MDKTQWTSRRPTLKQMDSGTKKEPQRTYVTRFCRTFRWTFWCDLPEKPCFTGKSLELVFGTVLCQIWSWYLGDPFRLFPVMSVFGFRLFPFSVLGTVFFGRFANGYFRNGSFEFQCEERHTIFRGLAGHLFLSEGSILFRPSLFLGGGVLGTFHWFSKYPFAKYPFASLWFLGRKSWPKSRETAAGGSLQVFRSFPFFCFLKFWVQVSALEKPILPGNALETAETTYFWGFPFVSVKFRSFAFNSVRVRPNLVNEPIPDVVTQNHMLLRKALEGKPDWIIWS